jgi:hypothetical protein
MPVETNLPDELKESATMLEERYQMLRVPTRKIPAAEWAALPADVRKLVPAWIPLLLESCRLAGGVLETFGVGDCSVWPFALFEPNDYLAELAGKDMPFAELPSFGFIPIATDTKGNVWVTKMADGPTGEIYLLDRSGTLGRFRWAGGEPTKRNGLVFASSRLALLFACMAVSEVSFHEMSGTVSVLWNKEKQTSPS